MSWQIFRFGSAYVAYEYDHLGYTGRYAYVNSYTDYPKPSDIRGERKAR